MCSDPGRCTVSLFESGGYETACVLRQAPLPARGRVDRATSRWGARIVRRPWYAGTVGLLFALSFSGIGCNDSRSEDKHARAILDAIKAGNKARAIELIRAQPGCVNTGDPIGVGAPADTTGVTRGWTMLHLATYCGQNDVCEALLAAGASVNAEVDGVTPLDATLGTNPKRPRPEDIHLFRSGDDGRIPAVVQVLRKNGARGRYFEAAVNALRRVNDTTEMKTLDALTNGLRP